MNAGRDVERLIAGWLLEEAAPGAPDRVLESTRQIVRRTNQRQIAALWREPMFTPARLAAMAAMLVLALGAGFLVGRTTGVSGPGDAAGSPTPTPGSSAAAPALADYRAARNAICGTYQNRAAPYKETVDPVGDPASLPAADRAIWVTAMTDLVGVSEAMAGDLDRLAPPSAITAAHAVSVSDLQELNALLRASLRLLELGDGMGARALLVATDPLSAKIAAFEARYSLVSCP
jgi:hypothetical protein